LRLGVWQWHLITNLKGWQIQIIVRVYCPVNFAKAPKKKTINPFGLALNPKPYKSKHWTINFG
jgi:hypothetical protein